MLSGERLSSLSRVLETKGVGVALAGGQFHSIDGAHFSGIAIQIRQVTTIDYLLFAVAEYLFVCAFGFVPIDAATAAARRENLCLVFLVIRANITNLLNIFK